MYLFYYLPCYAMYDTHHFYGPFMTDCHKSTVKPALVTTSIKQ
jgi:hypothetical protein